MGCLRFRVENRQRGDAELRGGRDLRPLPPDFSVVGAPRRPGVVDVVDLRFAHVRPPVSEMRAGGELVVKLPKECVGALAAAGAGVRFDAGRGPMKEWATVVWRAAPAGRPRGASVRVRPLLGAVAGRGEGRGSPDCRASMVCHGRGVGDVVGVILLGYVSRRLLRRGLVLESATLGWNVVGVIVCAVAAVGARSVALAGFGLDSLIEIAASTVVVWELTGAGRDRERTALRVIGWSFLALSVYIPVQGAYVLSVGRHPGRSSLGIAWTALTCVVMLALAAGKRDTGRRLGNRVLLTEGRVTLVDALLASAVLVGLVLNAGVGWWWADPLAGFVLVFYGVREGRGALRG